MAKTGTKFNPQTRLQVKQWVWEYRTQKAYSQPMIVTALKNNHGVEVTQATVSRYLKQVGDEALKTMREQVERIKSEQTATLEFVLAEALDAWKKSRESQKQVRQKKRGGPQPGQGGALEETTSQVKEMVGEVSFLREARAAMEDIRNVWNIGRGDGQSVSFVSQVEVKVDDARTNLQRKLARLAESVYPDKIPGEPE